MAARPIGCSSGVSQQVSLSSKKPMVISHRLMLIAKRIFKVEVKPKTKSTGSYILTLIYLKQKSLYNTFLKPIRSDLQRQMLCAGDSRQQCLGCDFGCLSCTCLHREAAADSSAWAQTGPTAEKVCITIFALQD